MSKRFRIFSAILVLLLLSTMPMGCKFFDKEPNPTPPIQSQTGNEDTGNEPNTEDENKVKRGIGIYQGQIDSNSIEIEVQEGTEKIPTAFQLSGEIKENFAEYDLDTGDSVSFSYETPQAGQPILTEITKQE